MFTASGGGSGSSSTKSAASVTKCPAITTSKRNLTAYIEGAGIADDPKGPLFRTIGRGTGELTRTPLPQANAYMMIQRRAGAAAPSPAAASLPTVHAGLLVAGSFSCP
jgi:hypothetical protein